MGSTKKSVSVVIIVLGAVAAVIFLRNVACSRSTVPALREATGTEWEVAYKCGKCGHEFVGYVVGLEPGTKPRDGKRRYKKPADAKWVPQSDGPGVAQVKMVACPKCGAEGSDVAIDAAKMTAGEGQIMH